MGGSPNGFSAGVHLMRCTKLPFLHLFGSCLYGCTYSCLFDRLPAGLSELVAIVCVSVCLVCQFVYLPNGGWGGYVGWVGK